MEMNFARHSWAEAVRFWRDNAGQIQYGAPSPYGIALENDAAGSPVYVGLAPPGTAKSTAKWQIRKLAYDAAGGLADVCYAGGSAAFTKVWDDRGDYVYV